MGLDCVFRMRFGAHRHQQTGLTADEANALVLRWKKLKKRGQTPDDERSVEMSLGDAARGLFERKKTTISKKTRRPLRAGGLAWWERILKPWWNGRFADVPVSALRRATLEDAFLARAVEAPKSANDELTGLKAALRFASSRGGNFDRSIFEIEPVVVVPRIRRALKPDALDFLIPLVRDDAQPLFEFVGTVGMRIGELLSLDDDQVDLQERTITVPAHKCKEAKEKIIDLTRDEADLLRAQLAKGRSPSVTAVFTSARGKRWTYTPVNEVFNEAVRAAAAAWRESHALGRDDDTPFEWLLRNDDGTPRLDSSGESVRDTLQIHDLRSTAATMMRDAGFTKEQAAQRLGHSDTGQLLDRLYDVGDRHDRSGVRKAVRELAPDGLRAAAKRAAEQRGPLRKRNAASAGS